MTAYAVIDEDTKFRITGVCESCDPPLNFSHEDKFDKNLSEKLICKGKRVVVKGSYWEGQIPGTCCRARVEVRDTTFKHEVEKKGIATTKDSNQNIKVSVFSGRGTFSRWVNTQDVFFIAK